MNIPLRPVIFAIAIVAVIALVATLFYVVHMTQSANSGTSTFEQVATSTNFSTGRHFQSDNIPFSFSYPEKAGAVWIDDGGGWYDGQYQPYDSYVYRYPYDPDADYNIHSEHYTFKQSPRAGSFSITLFENDSCETPKAFFKRTNLLNVSNTRPLNNQKVTGYVLTDDSAKEHFIFQSGFSIIDMANSLGEFYSDAEFTEIINSITNLGTASNPCSHH
jgi:hypothetical protein